MFVVQDLLVYSKFYLLGHTEPWFFSHAYWRKSGSQSHMNMWLFLLYGVPMRIHIWIYQNMEQEDQLLASLKVAKYVIQEILSLQKHNLR